MLHCSANVVEQKIAQSFGGRTRKTSVPMDIDCEEIVRNHWPSIFIQPVACKAVKASENLTYCVSSAHPKSPFFLRLTSPSHRSVDAIHAEITFMDLIAANPLLHVCSAVPGKDGSKVQCVHVSQGASSRVPYTAILTHHAEGHPATDNLCGIVDYATVKSTARALGFMHAAAISASIDTIHPSAYPEWYETHGQYATKANIAALKEGPDPLPEIEQAWKQIFAALDALPTNNHFYGPIHGDLNISNFFVGEEDGGWVPIHIFDFDQVQKHWFAWDVGYAIYSAHYLARKGFDGSGPPVPINIEAYEAAFWEGYESAGLPNETVSFARQHYHLFGKLRLVMATHLACLLLTKPGIDEGMKGFLQILIDDWHEQKGSSGFVC